MGKTMIDDRDVIEGLEKLPAELQGEFIRIGALVVQEAFEEAEAALRAVLSRYDDNEAGLFRSMLGDVLAAKGDSSGARKLFRELSKEPKTRTLGLLGQAQVEWNQNHNADKSSMPRLNVNRQPNHKNSCNDCCDTS